MPDYYVDFNRGLDANTGLSVGQAWKNLSKVSALSAGGLPAGSSILLASDSVWELRETLSANQFMTWANFVNGTAASPITITGYGGYSGKPKISYKMLPQAGWWTWDASVSAWYLSMAWAIWGSGAIGAKIGSTHVVNVGDGWRKTGTANVINTSVGVNGVNADTLRFAIPFITSGSLSVRFYLAGAGINSTTDPTTAHGLGNVVIFVAGAIHAQGFKHTVFDGIEFDGGGLYCSLTAGTKDFPGTIVRNCVMADGGGFVWANGLAGSASEIGWDIRDNTISNAACTAIRLGGGPHTGYARNNRFSRGNLSDSSGGFIYMQSHRSTGGYAAFEVSDNYAEYAVNGVGERSFDGCCYYSDAEDDGTKFLRNVAAHSFKAYQCNSGKEVLFASNIAYDCVKFGTFTDADLFGATNYRLVNNLWISASSPTAYPSGSSEGAANFGANCVFSFGSSGAAVTGVLLANNLMIARGTGWSSYAPIRAYPDSAYSGGKPSFLNINTNAVYGLGSPVITSNNSTTDRTGNFPATVQASGDVVMSGGLPSAMGDSRCLYAGTDTGIAGLLDYYDRAYAAKPSIGPFEPPTVMKWLGQT